MPPSEDSGSRNAVPLTAILLLAAFLRLWRLESNGFGTEYYAAGVRSMMQSAHLFFFNAFDPAGALSLDKPPVAFWIQTAFVELLGFDGWVIHLPQALAGIASVALLYHLVRRPFGIAAGTIAGLLLAINPISVAIDRSNNTDSWLVLFLLLAAWAALRGRGRSLILAMALLGVAFNVKMLAAFVCGPALLAGWLFSTDLDWRYRLYWMAAAGIVLVVVSLSWSVAFDLTPKDERPYAGSTTGNSMLELVVVHNGLERFIRHRPQAEVVPAAARERATAFDAVPTGPLRLARPTLASQFAWLLPLSLLGAVMAGWRRRVTVAPSGLWAMWALSYGIVFSAAGGIFHLYYLSALAPPLCAFAAIGAVRLWNGKPVLLAIGLALTAAWQISLVIATLGPASAWNCLPLAAAAGAAILVWRGNDTAATLGSVALLGLPLAWALSAIFAPGNLTLPSASLPRWLGVDDGRGPLLSRHVLAPSDDPKLVDFLVAHRNQARFLVAAPTTRLVAPLIIRTGQPALAAGGYFGNEPIVSAEALATLAMRGEIRYVLLAKEGRQGGLARWVREHGAPVDESLWRSVSVSRRRAIELYELSGD